MTAKQVFKEAVKAVLTDEAFKLPSTEAKVALETAAQITEWMGDASPENEAIYEKFINCLFSSLLACFSDEPSIKTRKENMWKAYHQLRISSGFKHFFLDSIATAPASPTFYQHITDLCFKELVKIKFPIPHQSTSSTCTGTAIVSEFHLTFEEANALRYAAGYICFKLYKQIEASSKPRKTQMLSMLVNLVDNEAEGDHDLSTAEEWVNAIDRGGLCHISEHAYMFFVAMEEEVQCNIKNTPDDKITNEFKAKLKDNITYVKCYWSDIIQNEEEDDDADAVLDMIIDLWITIRGYAYCSSWIEFHKKEHQRGLQKSKALRKTL